MGGSLKALSEKFGLPAKDNAVLLNTKGKRYAEFDLDEMSAMAQYNKTDTDNTYQLFLQMFKDTPKVELQLMDMTARMIVYPQFVCDTELLKDTLVKAEQVKEALAKSKKRHHFEDTDNLNSNGNGLWAICDEWQRQIT